jgi:hypothetical protein
LDNGGTPVEFEGGESISILETLIGTLENLNFIKEIEIMHISKILEYFS